jgi:SAM-dependent methyltransferase
MMSEKPRQWKSDYGSIFQDASVVAAYEHRPTYPPETFDLLFGLIPPDISCPAVLDAGCGTGYIARFFAPYVERIDAVDISERMVDLGRRLPGGEQPGIDWIAAPMETAPLNGPYALIVTAASLHWMDWEQTLPRFAEELLPGGFLALVDISRLPNPWDQEAGEVLKRYSMNRDFVPYNVATIVDALEERGLFRLQGGHSTRPVRFRQSVDSWIESFHARNGLSRDRMDPAAAAACDAGLREAVAPFSPDGVIEQQVMARILWGLPGRGGG